MTHFSASFFDFTGFDFLGFPVAKIALAMYSGGWSSFRVRVLGRPHFFGVLAMVIFAYV